MTYLSDKETENIKSIFENDGVIAFPTDTVWGIGCLPENIKAVEKIYSIKSRDTGKPLILLGKNLESFLPYVEKLPETAKKIAEKYFPGALTLVIKKSPLTADYITAGFNTVGIRIPDCPVFIEMLEKCTNKGVIATTSANISEMGAVSTKTEVINSIGGKIDFILDNFGFTSKGKESTVVSINESGIIKVLRQGAVEVKI